MTTPSNESQRRAEKNRRDRERAKIRLRQQKEEQAEKVKGLRQLLKTFQPVMPKLDPAEVNPLGRHGKEADGPNKPRIEEVVWGHGLPSLPFPAGTPGLIGKSNLTSNARLRDLIAEKYTRMQEPLNLYKPLPGQRAFHESDAFIRLAVGSNRSGKTAVSCIEFARCVLNCDPYMKYPKSGMVYVVGKSLHHIADTIYKKLRKPGFFRIIPCGNGQWEVYQPWRQDHYERSHESVPSSPLIPERFIKRIAFENKAEGEVSYIEFTTGWEARFFSARGLLPQGSPASLVYFDEEIVDSQDGPWVPEMIARLTDTKGKMIWAATPQNGFANLLEMSDKADRQLEMYLANPVDNPKPDVVRFDLKIEENTYHDKSSVARFRRNLSDEDVMVRFGGMSLANSIRVYPEWSLTAHGYSITTIPSHWTRYVVIDPGHTICAALFAAVPPEDECPGRMTTVIAYDELYIPQCNAAIFGQAMFNKCKGQHFEAFIIDGHGARPTEAGSGSSIEEQYRMALESNRVRSRTTGYGFVYGSSDRAGGILKVHEFLMDRPGGRPRFLVATHPDDPSMSMCPMLHSEMKKYRKKRINNVIMDLPDDRGYTHLCQCLRYLCSYEPTWVEAERLSAGHIAWQQNRNRQSAMMSSASRPYVNFGPGE